jgi:hypothetical protein
MTNFHSRIMNLPFDRPISSPEYATGHRDARHAAAEIANEADALAVRLAEEVESHAITSANLERLQNRWDKRPVVDDLQARLAEAEQLLARWLKLYGGSLSSIIGKDTEDFLRTTDSATPRENARE